MPEFEEGTSLKEQLRVLLDRLETAQSNYPCKCCFIVDQYLGASVYDVHTISAKFDLPSPLSTCVHISLYPFLPHCGHPQKFQLCQAKVSAFIKTELPM